MKWLGWKECYPQVRRDNDETGTGKRCEDTKTAKATTIYSGPRNGMGERIEAIIGRDGVQLINNYRNLENFTNTKLAGVNRYSLGLVAVPRSKECGERSSFPTIPTIYYFNVFHTYFVLRLRIIIALLNHIIRHKERY